MISPPLMLNRRAMDMDVKSSVLKMDPQMHYPRPTTKAMYAP